jgi:hypothetical protein
MMPVVRSKIGGLRLALGILSVAGYVLAAVLERHLFKKSLRAFCSAILAVSGAVRQQL